MFKSRCVLSTLLNQRLKLNLYSQTCLRKFSLQTEEEDPEKKKKTLISKINVILPDKTVQSMTLEEAQKWAKRRNITLQKLADPPKFASYAGRDVYDMFTKAQSVKLAAQPEGVASASEFKDKKTLNISASIADHDFDIKMKHVKKWIAKNMLVVIVIADDGTGKVMEEKSSLIKEQLKDKTKITVVKKKNQTILTLQSMGETAKSE